MASRGPVHLVDPCDFSTVLRRSANFLWFGLSVVTIVRGRLEGKNDTVTSVPPLAGLATAGSGNWPCRLRLTVIAGPDKSSGPRAGGVVVPKLTEAAKQ
jgi:hypothetical protein